MRSRPSPPDQGPPYRHHERGARVGRGGRRGVDREQGRSRRVTGNGTTWTSARVLVRREGPRRGGLLCTRRSS